MAKDYKHRTQNKNIASSYRKDTKSIGLWRWMLITALIISFVVFLVYLSSTELKQVTPQQIKSELIKKEAPKQEKKPEPELELEPVSPKFYFYSLLREKEVVVPDYEVNTRTREERIGRGKAASYILQAGSFSEFKDADDLRARLASMGIESKVEKTKVGNIIQNRVKMGPYAKMTSVNAIQSRLRENGIVALVIEVGG